MRQSVGLLLVLAVGACGSVAPSGQDGGGGSGAGGTGGSAGNAGSGGAGRGGGSGGAAGSVGSGGGGGTGGCAPNQIWCPGCEPGTGACYVGGCPGGACPPLDGGAGGASGSGGASGTGGASPCQAVLALDRSCTTAADCFAGAHTTDCCGNGQFIGFRTSEQARFQTLEAQCDATYPGCGCPAATADRGRRLAAAVQPAGRRDLPSGQVHHVRTRLRRALRRGHDLLHLLESRQRVRGVHEDLHRQQSMHHRGAAAVSDGHVWKRRGQVLHRRERPVRLEMMGRR